MKQISESLDGEVGKTYDKSDVDVKVMIKKVQTKKLEKAGYKNIVNKRIRDSTLMNYSALLADEGNIAISQSYISKSNTSYAAEKYQRTKYITHEHHKFISKSKCYFGISRLRVIGRILRIANITRRLLVTMPL
jgi:hypothetical protein